MLIVNRFRVVVYLFGLFSCVVSTLAQANVLEGIRVWPSPDETRIVMDVKSEVEFSYFTLSSPNRLVIDLKSTSSQAKLPIKVTDSAIIKQIRASSPPEKGTFRLVMELSKHISPQLFTLPPTPGGQYGHRLVVDLPNETPKEAASNSIAKLKASRDISQLSGNDDIIVAVDPGHGGEDPGSIGPGHRFEKNVTISVAKKLADLINQVPGMKAILTRSGDYYVSLNKRTEIAREQKAHLLVSIHADAFNSPGPRGASVFVLNTRRANTEIARWVENHEEQSELLGGAGAVLAKNNSDKNISQTLLDLQFSHSQKEGYTLASDIISQLSKVAYLHRSKPVNASLAVLKSPDIPSVLIETGFISNPSEEKLLFQRSHQDKLARAIATAVVQYFKDNPPEGTLFANRNKTHSYRVQSGESLSTIAHRFGMSVDDIKKENGLKDDTLSVGQVLRIPGGHTSIDVPQESNPVETQVVTHVVKSGEYLGQIASRYKVAVADIKKENSLKSNTLWVGQKLKMTVSLKDSPIRKHTVARGEFLGKIADKYDVGVNSIREANHLKSDNLAIGQVLIIPNK